jgi:hypothetical protein
VQASRNGALTVTGGIQAYQKPAAFAKLENAKPATADGKYVFE